MLLSLDCMVSVRSRAPASFVFRAGVSFLEWGVMFCMANILLFQGFLAPLQTECTERLLITPSFHTLGCHQSSAEIFHGLSTVGLAKPNYHAE